MTGMPALALRESRPIRIILNIAGGCAIVATFFFVTLFLLDRYEGEDPLAQEAKSLRAALKQYRDAKAAYPILPDRLTVELKKELVGSGYLRPDSRQEPDKNAHYVSFDGKSYGLLFHIDRTASNPLGTACVIEVDTTGKTGWWGDPPKCKF
jgi:hypothetical protein